MTRAAIFSIHDVAPASLARVREIVGLVREAGHPPPLLLVVPGAAWTGRALDELRCLAAVGCSLAGHGWSHRAPPAASLFHRFHATLISRDQAEHLSRSREAVWDLVVRCHAWFGEHGFEAPDIYVPPAWALGPLKEEDLRMLPFRYYESISGFFDVGEDRRSARRIWMPLAGFEADTRFRQWALKVSNVLNQTVSARMPRPLRIGIHPGDLELPLAGDLRKLVRRPWRAVTVEEAVEGAVCP